MKQRKEREGRMEECKGEEGKGSDTGWKEGWKEGLGRERRGNTDGRGIEEKKKGKISE